jgi:type VII secretion-associated serine protease mycosin
MKSSGAVHRSLVASGIAVLISALCLPGTANADDVRARSWQLSYLHVERAQQLSRGQNETVAVIDTGVNVSQPELSGQLLAGTDAGRGFTGNGQQDFEGHGTAMATLIAGHGYGSGGGDGILGIAPGAMILPISVPGAITNANQAIADGISWAVDHGADVISLSVGGVYDELLTGPLEKAFSRDVVVVAGTGNRPEETEVTYPAKYPGVLAVTANNRSEQIPSLAITGPRTDLTAPGADIPLPSINGGYEREDGTSISTAIVAGVAALVRSKYPDLSAKEVVHRLEATADDKGTPGKDDQYGYGIVNPVRALTADVPPLTPSASPSPTAHAQPKNGTTRTPWILGGIALVVLLVAAGVTVAKISR